MRYQARGVRERNGPWAVKQSDATDLRMEIKAAACRKLCVWYYITVTVNAGE